MHTVNYQPKSWLRGIYYWGHDTYINKYLYELSFRINRSLFIQNIFHLIILRMINSEPINNKIIN